MILLAVGALASSCSDSSSSDNADPDPAGIAAPSEAVIASDAATTSVAPTTVAPTTVTTAPSTTWDPSSTTATTPAIEPAAEVPGTGDFGPVAAEAARFVERQGIEGAGLIVVHAEAGVVYEDYFGGFGPDRISLIASASKIISAGVLLHLDDDGVLDIDAPIEQSVDWAVGNPEMTPAQLVSNSSGLVGLWPNLRYAPYQCQWSAETTLQACGQAIFNGEGDDTDQARPDTAFRYGGGQWQLAGAVAEAASGKSWEQLIDEIYVGPCGLDSLGYVSLGGIPLGSMRYPVGFGGDPSTAVPTANPTVGGGAHITVRDYGELLLMHLRGGRCGDTQVLSSAALETMQADRIAEVYGGNASSPGTGYGMGWWIDRDTGQLRDPGFWGAVSWLDSDNRYAAYVIVEERQAVGEALKRRIEGLIHEAVVGSS